jgi:hypothetical protein
MKSSKIVGESEARALDARDLLLVARNVIDLLLTFTGNDRERMVQKPEHELNDL